MNSVHDKLAQLSLSDENSSKSLPKNLPKLGGAQRVVLSESNKQSLSPTKASKRNPEAQQVFSKKKRWTLNDFDIGRKLGMSIIASYSSVCLGSGKFGNVYLAREKEHDYIIAIKVLYKHQLVKAGMFSYVHWIHTKQIH